MKRTIIALTGTPGTGKTKASKSIKGFRTVELNRKIKEKKLYSSFDRKRGSYVADMKKAEDFLDRGLKPGKWIVDSHLSHLLPPSMVDKVIVLRCDPKKLETRLKKRRWSKEKVRENVEAELMNIISAEAREKHKNVYDIDTTGKSLKEAKKAVSKVASGRGKGNRMVEWMSKDKS